MPPGKPAPSPVKAAVPNAGMMFDPWTGRWIPETRKRQAAPHAVCPWCRSPFCDGTNCPAYGYGAPDPSDREAWKAYWRNHRVRRTRPDVVEPPKRDSVRR